MAWRHKTRKNYRCGMRLLQHWYEPGMGLMTPGLFELFLVECMGEGMRYATVNCVRSWLRLTERVRGVPPQASVVNERVRAILKGYMAISMLRHFTRTWPVVESRALRVIHTSRIERPAVAAFVTLGYAFMLRWSETCDVWSGRAQIVRSARGLTLYLSHSKTDPLGQGTTVLFENSLFTGEWAQLVTLALAYCVETQRRSEPEPASGLINGTMRAVLGTLARFHGLRHGRCSDLIARGMPKSCVQEKGRWRSVKAMTLYTHVVSLEQDPGLIAQGPDAQP